MYERMYRNRWIDSAYHVGHLKQIADAQDECIAHMLRCSPDVCVYNLDSDECPTTIYLLKKINEAKEWYENYVTRGCPTKDTPDTERESKARASQGAARVGYDYNLVRQGGKDDDWFGGIV